MIDVDEFKQRMGIRDDLRDWDAQVEGMSELNRLQKDRERAFPRDTTAALGDERMRRRLPAAGDTRVPLSARQRNARRKARSVAQESMPKIQVLEQRDLVDKSARWTDINDKLSDQVGDVYQLDETDQVRIRRVDKAIQAFEKNNDRGHVVYANVALPNNINSSNVDTFVTNSFTEGVTVHFDRYTAATHQLHETAGLVEDNKSRLVVFEMETRRGAYLGSSDKVDDTRHLLPRGMTFEVVGVHYATFQNPDGTTGRRRVVQLRDITPDTTPG